MQFLEVSFLGNKWLGSEEWIWEKQTQEPPNTHNPCPARHTYKEHTIIPRLA